MGKNEKKHYSVIGDEEGKERMSGKREKKMEQKMKGERNKLQLNGITEWKPR